MEAVHSLQLEFNIAAYCSIIMGYFNIHIGKHKVGSLDSEVALNRHKNDILAYHAKTSHFLHCMHPVDKCGESFLR